MNNKIIQEYYDANVEIEWERIKDRTEFLLTCRYLERYIKPGDKVLDIGGGPGRYSLALAAKNCDVTLLDLSPGNIAFAAQQAKEQELSLTAICGDARHARDLVPGEFDHVLLMGPLYHLPNREEQEKAVHSSLACLKSGGILYAAFISLYAGMIYELSRAPADISLPMSDVLHNCIAERQDYSGPAFTSAYFIYPGNILPFMAPFPLEKMHLLSQEGVSAHCEPNLLQQPPAIQQEWLELSERLCEQEDLLSWAEHLLYIGRKKA